MTRVTRTAIVSTTCLAHESDLAMPRKDPLRAEIDKLQAELQRAGAEPPEGGEPGHAIPESSPAATGGVDSAAYDSAAFDVEQFLRDLQGTLAAAADDAEETVVSHPLVAVSAAFLLGVLIGRFSRRFR